MSATAYGWLVLRSRSRDARDRRSAGRCCPGRSAGWIASARDRSARSVVAASAMLLDAPGPPEERASLVDPPATYVDTAGFDVDLGILVDPLSVFMCLVVSGVSFLIHLYSVAYMESRPRLRALLRLPQLLRLLDAAAGPGGQLRAADRGLGVRRRGVLPADLLLVPARHRHRGRHQGVRDQRDRRRRPGDRRLPAVRRDRRARLRGRLRARRRGLPPRTTARSSPPACCCSSARSRSRPSCRCTPGCRTRWRARRRSPR